MADGLSVAASVAGLVSLSLELGQITYSYVCDVVNAPKAQRRYLQETLALSEVLVRLEDALEESETAIPFLRRAPALSGDVLSDCKRTLASQKQKLEKERKGLDRHVRRLAWPFQERELKKVTDDLHRFRQVFADCLATNTSVTTTVTLQQVNLIQQGQAREQLLGKLRVPANVLKQPVEVLDGTGSWFVEEHLTFEEWRSSPASVLYCFGPPGVGKTALALIAADKLAKLKTIYVLRFFADYLRQKEQTEAAILQHLLFQVAEQTDRETIPELSQFCDGLSEQPSASELASILTKACRTRPVYVVFDALDEVQNVKQIVSRLKALNEIGCHIMITSRGQSDTTSSFSHAKMVEIRADKNDLIRYVQRRFEDSDFGPIVDAKHPLIQTIVDKASGLFLLCRLLVDNLLELPTLKKMRSALNGMPSHLDQAYESTIARIDGQPKALRDLAHRAMSWVLCTKEPLTPLQITHALAIDDGDEDFDEDNITTLPIILRVCAGLLTVDEYHGTLVFVHMSAYEFVSDSKRPKESAIHKDITEICLTYLQLRPLRSGSCKSVEEMEGRLQNLPFLAYSGRYWGEHLMWNGEDPKLIMKARLLLDEPRSRAGLFQILHYKHSLQDKQIAAATFETMPKGQSRLHVACCFGLSSIASAFLLEGDESGPADQQNWTPLHWAASRGHIEVVRTLLQFDRPAPIDGQDEQGWTAAIWASFRGDLDTLKLLLEHSADLSLKDIHGWTALRWAVAARRLDIVDFLQKELRQRLEVSAEKGTSYQQLQLLESAGELPDNTSAVEWAASLNDEAFFENALIRYGSDENYIDYLWSQGDLDPPVSNLWRLANKAEAGFGIEIERPGPWKDAAYDDFVQSESRTTNIAALEWTIAQHQKVQLSQWKSALLRSAVKDEKLPIVKLLLDSGASPNDPTESRTALHIAAYRTDPAYARILLKYDADVAALDHYKQTPLHQAVVNGFPETVQALVEGGSDVNAWRVQGESQRSRPGPRRAPKRGRDNKDSKTALMLACGYRTDETVHQEQAVIIDTLIQNGADLTVRDTSDRTCLHYAAMCGQLNMAEEALAAGIDVDCADVAGSTPLHLAVNGADLQFVQFLLDNGANAQARDEFGRHAIHYLEFRDVHSDTFGTTTELYRLLCPTPVAKDVLNFEFDAAHIRGYWSSASQDHHTVLSICLEKEDWQLAKLLIQDGAKLPREGRRKYNFSDMLSVVIRQGQPDFVRLAAPMHLAARMTTDEKQCYEDLRWDISRSLQGITTESRVRELDEVLGILASEGVRYEHESFASLASNAAVACDLESVPHVLTKHGIDVFRSNDSGKDASLEAVVNGHYRFLRGILQARASSIPQDHWLHGLSEVDLTDDIPTTLDHICAALVKAKMLEASDQDRPTALLLTAVTKPNHDLAMKLLSHGADSKITDEHGWRPIHYAALNNDPILLSYLLDDHQADIHARVSTWFTSHAPRPTGLYVGDNWPGTALHIACILGHAEIVEILLNHGLDPNESVNSPPKVYDGSDHVFHVGYQVPLNITLRTGSDYSLPPTLSKERLQVARLLLEHGAKVGGATEGMKWAKLWRKFVGFEDVWEKLREVDRHQGERSKDESDKNPDIKREA